MATRKLDKAQLAAFKKEHARLYKAGLVSKPARSQKPTRHALETHEKFRAFLDGKAQVVSVPTNKVKDYSKKFFKYKNEPVNFKNKVLVPKGRGKERARYSKKEGEIISTRLEGGIKVKRRFRAFSIEELKSLEGKNVTFSVIIVRGHTNEIFRTKTIDEMANIFARGSWRNFADWAQYVNVEKSERARAKIDQKGDE